MYERTQEPPDEGGACHTRKERGASQVSRNNM